MPLVDKALLGDGLGFKHGDARKKTRKKRTRLGEAVTATCRLLLALGGTRACPEALRALAATLERAIATQPEACAAKFKVLAVSSC